MAQDHRKRPGRGNEEGKPGGSDRKRQREEHVRGWHTPCRPVRRYYNTNAAPIAPPVMVASAIHASFFSCCVAALAAPIPCPPTVTLTVNVCVGSMFGLELIRYMGLIGAPSYWYICSLGPRAGSW